MKITFVLCLLVFPFVSHAQEIPRTEAEYWERYVATHPLLVFIEDKGAFIEVIRAESHFRPNAVNYNCYYGKRSTTCKRGDEAKAWSVDCGLIQRNVKGTVCPPYLFDPDISIAQGVNLYLERGLQPWDSSKHMWQKELALRDP